MLVLKGTFGRIFKITSEIKIVFEIKLASKILRVRENVYHKCASGLCWFVLNLLGGALTCLWKIQAPSEDSAQWKRKIDGHSEAPVSLQLITSLVRQEASIT